MKSHHRAQRPDCREVRDAVRVRHQAAKRADPGQHHHTSQHQHTEGKGVFELAKDGRDLIEERGFGLLFCGGAPRHVGAEHVRSNGLANVDRDAAEEDGEQRQPLEILKERADQAAVRGAVAQHAQRDGAERLEHDHDAEVDPEAVRVVVVQIPVEPADQEVVEHCEQPRRSDRVVRADVRQHGDLRHQRHVGRDEVAEKRCDGAAGRPVAEGVEDELRTPVGVFLPARELVIDGQRDTFLELVVVDSREAQFVAFPLQTQCHVKILGHGLLRPVFFCTVLFVRDVLECAPPRAF